MVMQSKMYVSSLPLFLSSCVFATKIEFYLFNKLDLAIVEDTCFNLTTTNNSSKIKAIDEDSLFYELEIPNSSSDPLPTTLDDIIKKCDRLQKTYTIDGVLTRDVVTNLDKIMLPIFLTLCFVFIMAMVYYKNFSKYKNIVELDGDSDSEEDDAEDDSDNDNDDNKHKNEEERPSELTTKQTRNNTLDSIKRNDSVIPGKIKSIGMFADNSVAPGDDDNNNKINVTVNLNGSNTPMGSKKQNMSDTTGVNLYQN